MSQPSPRFLILSLWIWRGWQWGSTTVWNVAFVYRKMHASYRQHIFNMHTVFINCIWSQLIAGKECFNLSAKKLNLPPVGAASKLKQLWIQAPFPVWFSFYQWGDREFSGNRQWNSLCGNSELSWEVSAEGKCDWALYIKFLSLPKWHKDYFKKQQTWEKPWKRELSLCERYLQSSGKSLRTNLYNHQGNL